MLQYSNGHGDQYTSTSVERHLETEADHYVHIVIDNVKAIKSLCPLDTPSKLNQALPFFEKFYRLIGYTTLDLDLEITILRDDRIVHIMSDVRHIMEECEAALEVTFAEKISVAQNRADAWNILKTTPLHEFYEHAVKSEWACLQAALGRAPLSIAILGSGAMPETAIWVCGWAEQHSRPVKVHCLELIPERLEQGAKVLDALFGPGARTFEAGDIRVSPKDLCAHDVVYFNAAVGETTAEKEDLLLSVVSRMRSGAFVLCRSTHSIKTMAYPPAKLQTQRILQRLRPYLTCQLNGEAGKNTNSSFIISQVI